MCICSVAIRIYFSFTLYTLFANIIFTVEVNALRRGWSKERITKDVAAKLAEIVANGKPKKAVSHYYIPEDDRLFYTRKLNKEEYDYSNESEGGSSNSEYDDKTDKNVNFRTNNEKKVPIDINDIVEKVRSKIEEDLKMKYGLDKISQKHKSDQKNVSHNNRLKKTRTRPNNKNKAPKPKRVYDDERQVMNSRPKDSSSKQETQKFAQDYQPDHILNRIIKNETTEKWFELVPKFEADQTLNREPPKSVEPEITDSNGQFKKIKLSKHDSYEDYVTPAKEKDFYSSGEKKRPASNTENQEIHRQRTAQPRFRYRDETSVNPETTTSIYYDEESPSVTEEIHARTENLGGDYVVRDFPKRIGASFRPTRNYYKMTSPNYYGKLSTFAEKYNFNEPLPDKDREKENLRHIGNPPARINGKIRMVKNKQGYFE